MDDAKFKGQDARTGSSAGSSPRRRTPWNTVEGRVISLVSRKGGVGKTTSAVNLGAALALNGHTVLIIGTDPQCGVCRTLGTPPLELRTCLNEIFSPRAGGRDAALTDLALTSPLDGLYFVSPRIISLNEEEQYLGNLAAHADVLVREVDRARNFYDTILIDCPPSLGAATRAALLASDSYLVPVQAEELCRDSVAALLEFIDAFKDRSYPDLDPVEMDADGPDEDLMADFPSPLALEGIFLTMASERTRMGRHVAAQVSEEFGDLVLAASVPRTTRLAEMALRGKPSVIYDRRSAGSRAYFDLADELIDRYSCADAPDDSLIDAMIESMSRSLDTDERSARSAGPATAVDDFTSPEMVSLEELLAEEEHRSGGSGDDDWEDGNWSGDYRGHGRVN
jgi:chromosome partitioning protein